MELPAGEVQVWRCAVIDSPAVLKRCRRLLTPAERRAADRFVFADDRRRFTTVRACLRRLLAGYLGQDPLDLVLVSGEHGKLRLDGSGPAPRCRFNVSHARSCGLIAVAADLDVGIDVEWSGRRLAHREIARRLFAPQEIRALEALPPAEQAGRFLALWTLKEAVVKALGGGLSVPLDSFAIRLDPGRPPALTASGDHEQLRELTLLDLRPGPGYVGGLAVRGAGWEPRFWTADGLLR